MSHARAGVKAADAGARDVREYAIQRDTAFLVGIEALVQHVSQETPVLRDAFAVNPCHGR